ncbi:MAG TPA: class I SAM-dependent methyltransferase [Nocardioides sp.]|nr:class I SAM-dependent methyltransferase [Nocardioides sp.]
MSSTPSELLLVSSSPHDALAHLGAAATDVTVGDCELDLRRHDAVLLSAGAAAAAVQLIGAELDERPLTVAIDLSSPPTTAALTALTDRYEGRFTRWGDLPVLLVETTGTRHIDPSSVVALAEVAHVAPDGPDPLGAAALAHADREQQRLRDRIVELRGRLDDARSRSQRLARERHDAQARARSLEGHPLIRLTRILGRVARRVPGGRVVVLLILVLAVLGIGLAAVGIAAGGRGAAAAVLVLVAAGVALNLALTLAVLRTNARAATSRELAALRRHQRSVTRDLASLRATLARQQESSRQKHGRLTTRLTAIRDRIDAESATQARERVATMAQMQETIRLFTSFPVAAAVPPMGGWAASADLVGALVDEFLDRRPDLVVECGSGVSTLWLATAARQHSVPTRIVALEHDAHYAQQTRALLARHGLSDIAEVRHAPLQVTDVGGTDHTWYSLSALQDLDGVGLLFVDGPPAALGEHARYPALPLLEDRLAARCSIVLDDMIREDEQEVAALWHERLPDLTRIDLRLEKGATILRRG